MNSPVIFTIGHSRHSLEAFIALLRQHAIAILVDVRTCPASRFVAHFNAPFLQTVLREAGVVYVHHPALGGKPMEAALRSAAGAPNYDRIRILPAFQAHLDALLERAATHRIALMCAEADPRLCHRERLIAPALRAQGATVNHILPDGSLAPPPAQAAFDI